MSAEKSSCFMCLNLTGSKLFRLYIIGFHETKTHGLQNMMNVALFLHSNFAVSFEGPDHQKLMRPSYDGEVLKWFSTNFIGNFEFKLFSICSR